MAGESLTVMATQSLPLPPQSISDAFLAQGIVGAVALLALGVAGYIYRGREKDRVKHEAAMLALQEKHEKLQAAKDAVNQKLQEDRIVEMRTSTTELGKAVQTVADLTEANAQAFSQYKSALEAASLGRRTV